MVDTIQVAIFGDLNITIKQQIKLPSDLVLAEESMLDVYRHRVVSSWADNGGTPVADLLPPEVRQALASIPSSGKIILTERQKQAMNAAHWTQYPPNPGNTGC